MGYPENAALLAAVIADAEDDLPRLVYADWLEEHGDPIRAEYIRNQCALFDRSPADPDYIGLAERKPELLAALFSRREELAPKLPKAVGFHNNLHEQSDGTGPSYQRGFPYFAREPTGGDRREAVRPARAFAEALPEVIATTTLRGLVCYDGFSRHLAEVLTGPAAGHLSAVAVLNDRGEDEADDAVAALLASPAAPNLRWLELSYLGEPADVDRLAGARALPRLRRLDAFLGGRPAALRRLLSAGWFGRLRRVSTTFSLENRAVGVAGLAKLPELHTLELHGASPEEAAGFAGRRRFPALGRLALEAGRLRGDGAAALARARLPALTVLELRRCDLHTDDAVTLARSPLFERLTALSLSDNEVGDKGVAALAASPCAAALRVLRLGANAFGASGLAALARPGAFPSLTTLDLHSSLKRKASAADVARFLSGLSLPRLRRLDLAGWPVEDAGARALATNPTFAHLTSLNLASCVAGPKAAAALLASPHLQGVVRLEFGSPRMGKAVEALKDRAVLPHLGECWLPGVTDKVKARLQAARPDVVWF